VPRLPGTQPDALHTGNTPVLIHRTELLSRNRAHRTTPGTQSAACTASACLGLHGDGVIRPVGFVSRHLHGVLRQRQKFRTFLGKSAYLCQVCLIRPAGAVLCHNGMLGYRGQTGNTPETSGLQAVFQLQHRIIKGPVPIGHNQNGLRALTLYFFQLLRNKRRHPAAETGNGCQTDIVLLKGNSAKVRRPVRQINEVLLAVPCRQDLVQYTFRPSGGTEIKGVQFHYCFSCSLPVRHSQIFRLSMTRTALPSLRVMVFGATRRTLA
jgi:hypothetical protein